MPTSIPARINPPVFATAVAAANLPDTRFSWSAAGVVVADDVPASAVAAIKAVVAAHDPDAPAPLTAAASCSRLGLIRAFKATDRWDAVRADLQADPDVWEEWQAATEIRATDPLVRGFIAKYRMSNADVLALIALANSLV